MGDLTADIPGVSADLIGVLYDYDPATGQATEIARSAYRLEGDGPVKSTMFPADYVVRAGHRLAIHVTDAHPQFMPHSSGTTVAITGATVTVPFLTYERRLHLEGEPASAGPFTVRPPAGAIADATVEAPLPGAPLPMDEATAARLQPEAGAPGGLLE